MLKNDYFKTLKGRRVFAISIAIYMFNFIYIYSFIPMSGCVGIGPSALLFLGASDAVMMALLLLLVSVM
jgi:hypothetical protein